MKILDYYLQTYQGTATRAASSITYSEPKSPTLLRDNNLLFQGTAGYCFPLGFSGNSDLLARFIELSKSALEYFYEMHGFDRWPDVIIASSVLPNQISVEPFCELMRQSGMNIDGNVHFVSTACTSAATAMELFKVSHLNDVIILGIDLFSEITVSGFNSIGAFSSEFPEPFSERNGMGLGDGIGGIYLSKDSCAEDYVFFVDIVQLSIEAFHATTPDPEARVAVNMVNQTLERMGRCKDITWCLHATGTQSNDRSEGSLVRKVQENFPDIKFRFLEYKSIFGHTLGACPLVELLALIDQKVHGKEFDRSNLFNSEDGIASNVINTNLAFGGHNSIVAGVING